MRAEWRPYVFRHKRYNGQRPCFDSFINLLQDGLYANNINIIFPDEIYPVFR